MDLIEDPPGNGTGPAPGSNAPEFTVSEISGAVKRLIEGEFGLVRVRGEVSRVSRPVSGHLYFDLKDDRSVIASLCWKGQVPRLAVRPEEGIEVVATGRLTTFPGQSKYQLVVEALAPAGVGALMAMLERRRAALAAEGLFDPARKRPIPVLPAVIGVVTSPSGAVIRDILHRLRDRFPRPVLVWPVAVQGERCAAEVAAAIRGFNAIAPGGPVPRPDVIIVARGGGSIEDLWGFNEEAVVRAAAASVIPLISAVGHETDTTLIDLAADLRAPTPTAAAELAVPVRADLLAALADLGVRALRAAGLAVAGRRQRLADLSRALPRPEALAAGPRQRFDQWEGRLAGALGLSVARRRERLLRLGARVQPAALAGLLRAGAERLAARGAALGAALARRVERRGDALAGLAKRLEGARARALAAEARRLAEGRVRLAALALRLEGALGGGLDRAAERVARLDRLRLTLGPAETLKRGFAIVRADGAVVTSRAAAERGASLEIEFHDGRMRPAGPMPRRRGGGDAGAGGGQGSLF
jgi:exodeoxyribonuclease VII large subunit